MQSRKQIQAPKEEEKPRPRVETEQVDAPITKPLPKAMIPESTKETQDQQLDLLAELHVDKPTNEEPPQALTQPPTALASTKPTAEETTNLQIGSSQQSEDILAIFEEE